MELIQTIIGTFLFENRKPVRVMGTHMEPLFVANDICNILGINNSHQKLNQIPDSWKFTGKLNTQGGFQKVNLISESGMYWIILRSNKPIARPFQEWVCSNVLPSIRKNGVYTLDNDRLALLEKYRLENEEYKLENEKLLKQLYHETRPVFSWFDDEPDEDTK